MDLSHLGKKFLNCNLNEDNILEFMVKEQNNQTEYVLKLYLLSVLEDHKHIDILKKYIFFDQQFEDSPQIEIINKKNPKEFWERLIELKNENKSKSRRKFLSIVYNTSLLEGFGYFICSIDENESKLNELNDKLNNEENLLEKIKLRKKIKSLIRERKKWKKSIIRSLHITEEEFDSFAEMSLKYYKTFDWEKIASSEICPTPWNINEYYFKGKLYQLMKSFHELEFIITLLEEDLFSAYKMVCACFDNDILQEDKFLDIISKIRNCMSKKYASLPSMINHTLLDQYRQTNLEKHEFTNVDDGDRIMAKTSGFWDKTAHYEEIVELMEELNERYEKIKLIENTNEYIYACYELTQDFLQIHPYTDGNGRTSKFLFYVLLLKRNVLPFTITDSRDLPKCFIQYSRTKSYVEARQKIMNDRVDNQNSIIDNSESIRNKK